MNSFVARRAIAVTALATAACHLLIGVEDEVGEPRPTVVDAAVVEAGAPADPCAHAAPPVRPDAGDGVDVSDIYVALSTLNVSRGGDGGVAYDLDGLCTCDTRVGADAAASCISPSGAPLCDGPEGSDNALSDIFETYRTLLGTGGIGYEEGARKGYRAVLLRLSRYNGAVDDPDVSLAILDAKGLDSPSECDGGKTADAGVNDRGDPLPSWLGCDSWKIPGSSLISGEPKFVSSRAWVSGGRLVARFDDGILVSTSGESSNKPLALNQTILSARLVRSGATGLVDTVEDGVIAARVGAEDLLSVIGSLPVGPTKRACEQSEFELGRRSLCGRRDMASTKLPGAKCDSLSVALVFGGSRVRKGGAAQDDPGVESPCDAAAFVCP